MITYENDFWSYRKDVSDKASQYVQGLLTRGIRKNAEDIAEVIPGAKVQNLQQFISQSKWNYTQVLQHTALNVNSLIGDPDSAALIIDESGIPKKGNMSVGVARQWLGCLGKTDNGQVGVYAALCNGNRSALINTRLYLPECWIDDKERCDNAHIPEERQIFKTKDELAIEMVDEALELEIKFKFVGADAGYGKGLNFINELEKRNLQFMVDIHKDQIIYVNKPKPFIPQKKGTRGRTPSEYTVNEEAVQIDDFTKTIRSDKWELIEVRDSTKGPLVYEVYVKQIYVWNSTMGSRPRLYWLVIRRDAETRSDYKYSFSNAPAATKIEELAFMQGQRFWIEHAIKVCKSDCGMADYEIRGWDGWHRHMALAMMAQFFLLKEMIYNQDEYPILSPRDVMEILAIFLPRKEVTINSVIDEMKKRHNQRMLTKRSGEIKYRENYNLNLT